MPDGALSNDRFYSPVNRKLEPHSLDWDDEGPIETHPIKLGRREVKIFTDRVDLSWLNQALDQFNQLAMLEHDWDSYGALPVDQETLEHAFEVFGRIMVSRTIQPKIGAINRGGISIEWHMPGKGLELRIESPHQVYAFYYNDLTGAEWEKEIGSDLDQLAPYLDQLGV